MLVMLMTGSHSCTIPYMDNMGICYDWEIQFLECAQNIPTSDEPNDTGSKVPPMPKSPFINYLVFSVIVMVLAYFSYLYIF